MSEIIQTNFQKLFFVMVCWLTASPVLVLCFNYFQTVFNESHAVINFNCYAFALLWSVCNPHLIAHVRLRLWHTAARSLCDNWA